MKLSDYDREKIEDIIWGHGDWFSAVLIRLIVKADPVNRELLRTIYPDHVALVEEYTEGKTNDSD